MTLEEIRGRKETLLWQGEELIKKAEKAGRDFSRMEQNRWDLLLAELQGLEMEADSHYRRAGKEASQAQKRRDHARLLNAIQQNPERARRTAYHEAGHAVVDYLLGHGVASVRLNPPTPDGRWGGGNCLHRRGDPPPVVHAAGEAAEMLEFGDRQPDWEGGGRRDLANLTKHYGRECTARAWVWRDVEEAQGLLRPAWRVVRAVAAALLEKGALGGDEAEKLIADALSPHRWRQAQVRIGNAKRREAALRKAS